MGWNLFHRSGETGAGGRLSPFPRAASANSFYYEYIMEHSDVRTVIIYPFVAGEQRQQAPLKRLTVGGQRTRAGAADKENLYVFYKRTSAEVV